MIDKKVLSIWKVDVPFQNDPLKKIAFVDNIFSFLQLKGKEILVVRFESKIAFVNLEDYSIVNSLIVIR